MASKAGRAWASRLGTRVTVSTVGEVVKAFVPPPLPPKPPLLIEQLYGPLEEATLGIGRLRGVGTVLPDDDLFLYTYVRKEALLSAQIEGTQSSLSELLRHETPRCQASQRTPTCGRSPTTLLPSATGCGAWPRACPFPCA